MTAPPQSPSGQQAQAARVLTARRVFTAQDATFLADAAVVLQRGRIAWVGAAAELPESYRGLPREDFGEATVLPGLIETHAHLGGTRPATLPDVSDPARHDQGWRVLGALADARRLASQGVTAVQSLGARHFSDVTLREAIDQGLLEGPRIVAAGPPLTTTGGHAWATTGSQVDSVDDIRRQVRDHHKAGVDVIKVMATGGFNTYGSAPWNAQFTVEELRVLVAEAHRLGKTAVAHAHGTQGIRRAVEAGVDFVAHASFIDSDGVTRFDPRLADQIAERGIFVDSASPPSHPPVPGETTTPRAYQLYRHGVKVVVGHDIGAVAPPQAYHHGLRQLEASGLPRSEVLVAATSRAAAAIGLAGVTGVVAAGYDADLLVVNGDPLADLAVLERPLRIILRGTDFRPDPVPAFEPAQRPAGSRSPLDVRLEWADRQRRSREHPLPQTPPPQTAPPQEPPPVQAPPS